MRFPTYRRINFAAPPGARWSWRDEFIALVRLEAHDFYLHQNGTIIEGSDLVIDPASLSELVVETT
jgi:hypothetical protein